jgi:uncharacterized protein (TIGR02231 family)
MLARRTFVSAVLLFTSGWAWASDAPIRAVVLYPGTAMVQRELSVAAGSVRAEIDGLPTDFTVDNLRLDGSEGIYLGQLTVKDQATADRPDAREAEFDARIQALKDKKAQLDIDAQSAGVVKDLLARLTLSSDKGSGTLAVDGRNLAGILDEVRKASTDSQDTIYKVDLQKRELDKQIEAAQHDLDQLRSGRSGKRSLAFDIVAERAGRVLIRYPLRGAGWRPAYRAELDSATGRMKLQRQAIIHQRTGEDWTGVSLVLSTGQPRQGVGGPSPGAWTLTLVPEQRSGWFYGSGETKPENAAPAPAPAVSYTPMATASVPPPPPEVEEFQAPFTTEFKVPVAVTLPSDGSETTLALGDVQLDTTVRLRTAPRSEAAAYVEVEAPRPQGDWLPGNVQLIRDGDYVGQTNWQPQGEDKLLLPFGRDDLIHVSYQRKQDRSGAAGIIGQRGSREITEVYTISSSHRTSMALLVLDPTPVSNNDDVKVEKDFTPAPESRDWDSRNGVVAWSPAIKPGETITLQTHYVVSYPQGRAVWGLP